MLDQLPSLAWLPSQQMALFRGCLFAPLPLGKAGPVRASFVRQVQKFPPHDMSKKNPQKPQDMSDKNANVHHKLQVCPQKTQN